MDGVVPDIMKTRLLVNRHHIAWNKNHPDDPRPVFSAKTYRANRRGNNVVILGADGEAMR